MAEKKKKQKLSAQVRARIEAKVDKIIRMKKGADRKTGMLELAVTYETPELVEYLERILEAEKERKGFGKNKEVISITRNKIKALSKLGKKKKKKSKKLKLKRKRMKDFETPGDYYAYQVEHWQKKLDSWNRGKKARRSKKLTKAEKVRAALVEYKNDPDVRDIFDDITIKNPGKVADGEE